jgi:hypothetical protein
MAGKECGEWVSDAESANEYITEGALRKLLTDPHKEQVY